jgi:hypothetical protein
MASIDIIGELRSFAQAKGWHFVYGNDQYANYEAGRFKYEPGDLILIADLNLSPTYGSGGGIDGLTFTGGIMLGQKREDTTVSTLDETAEQKYDARLKTLLETLTAALGEFACQHQYDITQSNFRVDINRFDINIDVVAGTITLTSV